MELNNLIESYSFMEPIFGSSIIAAAFLCILSILIAFKNKKWITPSMLTCIFIAILGFAKYPIQNYIKDKKLNDFQIQVENYTGYTVSRNLSMDQLDSLLNGGSVDIYFKNDVVNDDSVENKVEDIKEEFHVIIVNENYYATFYKEIQENYYEKQYFE